MIIQRSFLLLVLTIGFLVLIFLPGGQEARANDVYLASAAAGGNTGADCANAKIYTYFNSSGNWSATPSRIQIGPDTTVHLCGTITGTAGSNILTFQGSGTSGHPIILKFEAGAIVQSPVCSPDGGGTGNGGCISMFNRSFITIEGNNTGQATQGTLSGGGTIQNTDNGDALGHHCGTSGAPTADCSSTFIDGYACSNCTIQNLKMLNNYVKVLDTTTTGVGGDTQHSNTLSGSHITIANNQISNCGWCIFNNYGNGDTDVNVFNNDISGFGHGMMYATSNAGAQSISPALRFYGNKVHDPNAWTTPACNFHNDGLHTFGLLTGTSMDGLYIHDNYFTGTWGHCATGFVYIEQGSSNPSHAKSWVVWNNVGDATTETTWDNTNGWFGLFSGESGTQKVFNNTVLCGGPTHSNLAFAPKDGLAALSFENNVVSGCAEGVWMQPTPTVIDYNFYANLCGNGNNCFVWHGSFTSSFANWKSTCSCDSHAVQNNTPLLNTDGSPQAGSPVIGISTNLSSQATGELVGLQNDTTLGNTRTATIRPSGATSWDAGAFQFSSSLQVGSATPIFAWGADPLPAQPPAPTVTSISPKRTYVTSQSYCIHSVWVLCAVSVFLCALLTVLFALCGLSADSLCSLLYAPFRLCANLWRLWPCLCSVCWFPAPSPHPQEPELLQMTSQKRRGNSEIGDTSFCSKSLQNLNKSLQLCGSGLETAGKRLAENKGFRHCSRISLCVSDVKAFLGLRPETPVESRMPSSSWRFS